MRNAIRPKPSDLHIDASQQQATGCQPHPQGVIAAARDADFVIAVQSHGDERYALTPRLGLPTEGTRRLWQRLARALAPTPAAADALPWLLPLSARCPAALRAMAAIYRQIQSWEDLVDTLVRLIDAGSLSNMDPEEIKESYAELGGLYGEHLLRPQDVVAGGGGHAAVNGGRRWASR